MNRLLHLAKHIGVERVVFVGDERQHHAIEAGRPLYQMRQAGMTTASLTVIRRQRDPELRKAVELAAAGKLAETIAALSEQQRIREIAEPPERYRAIAEDYLRSHRGGRTTLVVSPAIEERSELNRVIRDLLVDRGEVARAGLELPTSTNLDLTRAQRAHARHYAVGDVIHFRRGSAKLEIAPGTYATVEASDERRNVLRLRAESGTIVEYRPGRFRGVEVFHAESRTIAIGDRIPLVRAHPSQTASQSRQSHHRDFSRSDRARPKPRLRLGSDRGGQLPGERLHVEHHPSGNSHDPHTFAGRPIRVVR